MTTARQQYVGVMGGMFDPVHLGHLQLAGWVHTLCSLDRLLLMPCGNPVHRSPAEVTAEQRTCMLELAVANTPWLQIDARETLTSDPSYTWKTLAQLHAELAGSKLFLLMGMDAFLTLDTWYRWQDLFTLAHLVVVSRPGYVLKPDELDQAFSAQITPRLASTCVELDGEDCGRILLAALPTPPISSTEVRSRLKTGQDTTDLLPPAVSEYIRHHRLYQ